MTSRQRTDIFFILSIALSIAPMVNAQPASLSCEEIPDCTNRFVEAQRVSKSGSHDDALRQFQSIYRQYGDPRILYPIAFLLQRLERPLEAIPIYQRYLQSEVETDPARLAKVEEQLHQAREAADVQAQRKVSVLPSGNPSSSPVPPSVTVKIDSRSSAPVPLYKRWWLWTIVGVSVVGIVVGASLGTYAKQPNWPGATEYKPFQQ